jgi:hypothetical protein
MAPAWRDGGKPQMASAAVADNAAEFRTVYLHNTRVAFAYIRLLGVRLCVCVWGGWQESVVRCL